MQLLLRLQLTPLRVIDLKHLDLPATDMNETDHVYSVNTEVPVCNLN